MSSLTLAGHAVEFSEPLEVGQGGPETFHMRLDGRPVVRRRLWRRPQKLRFYPSPLEFEGRILAPMRLQGMGFFLACIDPVTLSVKVLSEGFAYMKLLRVTDAEVEFSISADEKESRTISL